MSQWREAMTSEFNARLQKWHMGSHTFSSTSPSYWMQMNFQNQTFLINLALKGSSRNKKVQSTRWGGLHQTHLVPL